MVTIHINDKPFKIKEGQNLLHAGLSLGFDIPYFCWHPAMGSVGACRQCAVKQFKDEKDSKGRIVMACMTPAEDGTRISIDDPEVLEFRKSVIEWLMLNHPHDCPVCDEGGECHLQDMTVMTGHTYREHRFKKRTYRNQYLGPFIHHEMNRCIQCYRCVRFYRNVAGGRDFNALACHDHIYFGRHREGTLDNPYSGNLVEICPTGVFTDKTFKEHYTRKWDLQTAPSICVHCGLGCNTIAGERYGVLRRIRNRYHHHVNGYFLCDRGRYGYEFVNSENRIRRPLQRMKRTDHPAPVSAKTALKAAAASMIENRRIIGIGSPRASLEANFMLQQLAGTENFYAGVSDAHLQQIRTAVAAPGQGPIRIPTLQEAAQSDAVFILGEDLPNTAPLLALNLRRMVDSKAVQMAEDLQIHGWNDAAVRAVAQDTKGTMCIASPKDTLLDDIAMLTYRAAPDDLARLGFAVAAALDPAAPKVESLSEDEKTAVEKISRMLKNTDRPLIVSGTACGCRSVMEAAANVAYALASPNRTAGLLYVVPECNSLGMGLMETAGGLETAFESLDSRGAAAVVILENDLYRRVDAEQVDRFLDAVPQVIVLDHLFNRTVNQADLVFPAATFAEAIGTLVNIEGRAQRFFQIFPTPPEITASWRCLRDLMITAKRTDADFWHSFDAVVSAMAASKPVFSRISITAPGEHFHMRDGKIPRQSFRYSGRTAIGTNISVHEPKPVEDTESPLAFSMEGYNGFPPPSLIPRFWRPGWNSVQALNKFQSEIGGPLRGGDPGLRLMETDPDIKAVYFTEIPAQRTLSNNQYHLVALYHVFGSEELSILSPGIAERTPDPYLALSPKDAAALDLTEGDRAGISLDGMHVKLPVRIMPGLFNTVTGLPAGLPGIPVVQLPTEVAVEKEKTE